MCAPPFPIYEDVVAGFLAAHGTDVTARNGLVAHVLGT